MPMQIFINKKRVPYEVLFGFIATTILYLVIKRSDGEEAWFVLPTYFIILFYCLFFSLLVSFNYLKTIFDKKAGVIISETHFHKNVSIFSSDKIPWSEITEVEILKRRKRSFLILKLSDNDKYLRNKNFIERYILGKYQKVWGSPIMIPEKILLCDLQGLKQLIAKKIRQYSS